MKIPALYYSVLITPNTATTVSGTNTNLTISGLSANTSYSNLYVVAYNVSGQDTAISTSTLSFTTPRQPVLYTTTGATVTTYGNYTILTYSTGNNSITFTNCSPVFGYIVVGGGGGAGFSYPSPFYGGGGGGGVSYSNIANGYTFVQNRQYSINVGIGGISYSGASTASSISDSILSININATGGINGSSTYYSNNVYLGYGTGGVGSGGRYNYTGGNGISYGSYTGTIPYTYDNTITGPVTVIINDININTIYSYGGTNNGNISTNPGTGAAGHVTGTYYATSGQSQNGIAGIVIIYFNTYT
jgi:hypothetical protein